MIIFLLYLVKTSLDWVSVIFKLAMRWYLLVIQSEQFSYETRDTRNPVYIPLTLHCLNEMSDLSHHGWEIRSDNVGRGFLPRGGRRGLISSCHSRTISSCIHDRCTVHHPLKSRCQFAVSTLKTFLLWTLQSYSEWTRMLTQPSLLTRAELF